jgi:hypothetical protein
MGLLDKHQDAYYNTHKFKGLTNPHEPHYGDYQFISLKDIIAQFMIGYVGDDKIISKIRRADVAFFAQRAIQELSFDTFKSCKSQEIEVPPSLTMVLPQDYVNYTKLTWSDASGIEHIIYPTRRTSNPRPIHQDSGSYDYVIEAVANIEDLKTVHALDGIYKTLIPGMDVHIPGSTGGFTLKDVATDVANEITYIKLNSAVSTGQQTTFQKVGIWFTIGAASFPFMDNKIMLKPESSYLLKASYPAWASGDYRVTIPSGEDVSGLKEGMLVTQGSIIDANNTPESPFRNSFGLGAGARIKDIVTESNGDTTVITTAFKSSGASGAMGGSAASTNAFAQTYVAFVSWDVVSNTWDKYKSATPNENNNDDYEDDTYWPNMGQRYGLSPEDANVNGSFYIDCHQGKIHFSSNLSGKSVILKYISDSLGTDDEMQVHKFAEEAMYKWIAYSIMSTRSNIPEYIIKRLKKEKFAETRKAKLRLSNIKLEEITQIFRGKSKQIKH